MNNIEYLHYDEGVDHLTMYKSGEKIDSNVDLGLAVLSFNKEKEVIGVEFMGAERNFKIPLSVLQNLQSCKVEIRYDPAQKVIIINVLLQYQEQESPVVWSHAGIDLGTTAFSENFACSAT